MPYRGTALDLRGDPGLFNVLKRVAGPVLRRLPGPIGIGATAAGVLIGRQGRNLPPALGRGLGVPVPRGTPGARPVPGIKGAVQRILPGGKSGFELPKRKRMNFGNTKALTRASRRIDGFVRVAKRALKHTNYKVVSKSAGKAKRDLGRGHTHVR